MTEAQPAVDGSISPFVPGSVCPVCGGHERAPRGRGKRCHGFLSSDARYAHCSREELAGGIGLKPNANTYAHRLDGPCACGSDHRPNGSTSTASRQVVGRYIYHDAEGRPVFEVTRWNPKGFSQARIDPNGERVTGTGCMKGVQRVPYRLPELIAAVAAGDPVFIVEGEKDADALWDAGHVATCNSGGAGKWHSSFSVFFGGARDVRIIADNDDPGRKHALEVARSITAVGATVTLSRSPVGKDVSDLLAAGCPLDDLVDAGELLSPVASEAARNASGGDPNAKLDELAQLSPVEYDRRRKGEARGLGIRASTLDVEVAARRPQSNEDGGGGTAVLFADVEPWPNVVDGAELLQSLTNAFRRFLALSPFAAEAMALWVLHAHAHAFALISAILAFASPEKRCGKTTALALLQRVVPRPLPASNITGPALFRSVEKWGPTLLIDEADTFLKDNDELRGILNSGHNRNQAIVIRTAGEDHEPRAFRTWAPKAIALIGTLPPTLEDRAIVIQMRRRKSDEKIDRIRSDRDHGLSTLGRQCARWVADNTEALRDKDPELPKTLNDRAADNWRALVAIADVAGGGWPAVARKAAEALTPTEDETSIGVLLLADIRDSFVAAGSPDRMASADLCEALVALTDRPWSEIQRGGKALRTNGLARRLKPFGIRPQKLRLIATTVNGYRLEDFAEAFGRYLPGDSQISLGTPEQVNENNELPADPLGTWADRVPSGNGSNSLESNGCSGVPSGNPEPGREDLEEGVL